MMITTFLQELLFRKWIFTWLAPYSKTAVLVSTGLFCLFHMPINLAHLFLYIGMGLALSMVYQKRENLSACFMESLHLRCYHSSNDYYDVTENILALFYHLLSLSRLSVKKEIRQ